jgi:hypothetical protein
VGKEEDQPLRKGHGSQAGRGGEEGAHHGCLESEHLVSAAPRVCASEVEIKIKLNSTGRARR